jgi:hypothetical protein
MKEITVNPIEESSCILSQDFTLQRTLHIGSAASRKHLCVVCALMKHDFEERAPEPKTDWSDNVPLAKASIDGLPYASVYHLTSRGVDCTDCGERVLMTYDPEFAYERPVALSKT